MIVIRMPHGASLWKESESSMNRRLQFLQSETPIGTVGHAGSNACEESVSRHHAAVLIEARIPQALAVGVSTSETSERNRTESDSEKGMQRT